MENQQDYILNERQEQVLLTGYYGDGYLVNQKGSNYYYGASSIVRPLLELKYNLLGDLVNKEIKEVDNSGGYGNGNIFKLETKKSKVITEFTKLSDQIKLNKFTELGIALWFYDDGSLHQKNSFYNLCTHKYSKEFQEDLLIPKLKEFGINARVAVERKKDGRVFWYLRVNRHDGAIEVSEILNKYPVSGMRYKMWSSTTSQQWRKLQAELKSKGQVLSKRAFANELNKRLDKI